MSAPSEQEIADLLRDCDFAMEHAQTALVAFIDRRYVNAVKRDFNRLSQARSAITAALEHLPPAVPLSPEKEAKVGAVIAAALNKRFGDGTEEQLSEALDAWRSGVPERNEK